MRKGNADLKGYIEKTIAAFPAIEKTLPGKVQSLRAELSTRLDIDFKVPSYIPLTDTATTRYCAGDNTIMLDERGRARTNLIVSIPRGERSTAEVSAALLVWCTTDGTWRAAINSGEALDPDEQIDALCRDLSQALLDDAHKAAVLATRSVPRGSIPAGSIGLL